MLSGAFMFHKHILYYLQMIFYLPVLVTLAIVTEAKSLDDHVDKTNEEKFYKNHVVDFNATMHGMITDPCEKNATGATLRLMKKYNISLDQLQWLRSLDRQFRAQIENSQGRRRLTRARRVRRDCRALSGRERFTLFRTIQNLKFVGVMCVSFLGHMRRRLQ